MADQPPPGREPRPWMTRIAQAIVADLHLDAELVPRVATTILSNYECRYKKEQRLRAAERRELKTLMGFFTKISPAQATGHRFTMVYHLHRIQSVRALLSELENWKRNPALIRIVEIEGGYELWRV